MTGRQIIDLILDNNWLNAEFYFNAADDHSCILPVDEMYFTSGFNDEIDNVYYRNVKNPPETVLIEAI